MKILNKMKFFIALLLVVLMQFVFMPLSQEAYAVTPPDRGLGAADSYSVFGKAGVTATGVTHVWGNAGADSSMGLISTQVGGSIFTGAGVAGVETDARSTYDSLMSATQGTPTGLDLAGTHTTGNGNPITPGVYTIGSTTMNGAVELSGAGVYIFRSDADVTVATTTAVMTLTNGACASNVFWAIPSAMTIGTGAHIEGTIIAHESLISLATGATLVGRAISLISQVTLDANQITQPICAVATPTPTPTPTPTSSSSSSSSTSTSVCTEFIPTSNPDLFQIDRAGSTAVLHFTPVNNNMTYYYIAYGLSPGSEEYGVTFPASPSTGAVTYTINDLNPNLTYYFKVRAGNICAPGGWSSNKESNSKNPSLPNTGFAPRERSVPGLILIGISLSACFVYLARKREKFLIKQE